MTSEVRDGLFYRGRRLAIEHSRRLSRIHRIEFERGFASNHRGSASLVHTLDCHSFHCRDCDGIGRDCRVSWRLAWTRRWRLSRPLPECVVRTRLQDGGRDQPRHGDCHVKCRVRGNRWTKPHQPPTRHAVGSRLGRGRRGCRRDRRAPFRHHPRTWLCRCDGAYRRADADPAGTAKRHRRHHGRSGSPRS